MASTHRSASASEWAFHLTLVGKVAVIFSAAATAGLVALLLVVNDDLRIEYSAIVGSRLRAEHQLEITLWIFGLLLAALSGVTTWLLALYASFRFAGPILRFSRNIAQAIRRGPVAPTPLRRDDALQRESRELRAAIDELDVHYRLLRAALSEWQADPGPDSAAAVIACIQALDSRVRL